MKRESTEQFKGDDKKKKGRQVGNIWTEVWAYGSTGERNIIKRDRREEEISW
jgi:hypothetical protein